MDISSVSGNTLPPEIQAQYAVKCIQMARATTEAVGSIIEDTVEFSKEAMEKYLSELQ
ncbi:MAG: hypothetical protein MJ237_08875 [bacterium]|nr:hypothetical protein [bacterium]